MTIARQCTDTGLFTAPDADISSQAEARSGTIFIANSRGFRRDIVQWSLEAGAPPQLIGGQWAALGLSHLVQQESVENNELPDLYRRSRFSLNDHWADMRHFGIINNYGRAGAAPSLGSKSDKSGQGPENSPLMDRIVEEYFSSPAASGKHYRLLHLFPVHARETVIGKNSPRYNYYSGGFGNGPWQLALDENLGRIEGMNFDAIIIDSEQALNRIGPLACYRFLRGIAKALSPAGVLVMPHEQSAGDWVERLAHAGFSEASRLENRTLFQPPAATVSQAGSRELTSYARSLEFRLSAVYGSSSWKAMAPVRTAGAVLKKKVPAAPIPKRPPGIEGKDPLEKWRS